MLLATFFIFCACWLHVRAEIVSTKYGDIEGLVTLYPNASGPFKSVSKFLGVPFAAPPTGELRFKAPQPPKEWKPKVYSAKTHGSVCLQPRLFENFIEPGKFHFQRKTKQYWLFRWKYCILLSISFTFSILADIRSGTALKVQSKPSTKVMRLERHVFGLTVHNLLRHLVFYHGFSSISPWVQELWSNYSENVVAFFVDVLVDCVRYFKICNTKHF